MSVDMYACMYACEPNLLSCHPKIFDVTEKCDCHIANMTHTAIMQKGHIDPTFLYMYAKTTN